MPNVEQNVKNFPIKAGPIAMSEKNAKKAEIWAEGTDAQVEALGGTHSAKGWATSAEGYASDPNIVACGTNISSINTVAGNVSNVSAVAGISVAVSTVSCISADVTMVAGKKDDISTCAANISDISQAPTAASNASASATSASNSATNAQKWAEGSDSAVTPIGGTHSAKGWAEQAQSIVSSLGTVLHYKGSVADYAALQAVTGQIVGDVYNVTDTGDNYAWDGSTWDKLSGTVDLSAYRTADSQDIIDAGKQPLLPDGTTGQYLQKTNDGVKWADVESGPADAWTQTNLIAGDNITITQVQEPVIDSNTIGVFHFDNSYENAVADSTLVTDVATDTTYSSSADFATSAKKFGDACLGVTGSGANPSLNLFNTGYYSTSGDFTVDYWAKIYMPTNQYYEYNPIFLGSTPGSKRYGFYCNGSSSNIKIRLENSTNNVQNLPASWSWTDYWHYAIERDGATLNFFIGGLKVYTWAYGSGVANIQFNMQAYNYGYLYVDELRISNVARYQGNNFTPYNQPYSVGGAAKYQINTDLTGLSGYSTSGTYTLKLVNGELKWVQ